MRERDGGRPAAFGPPLRTPERSGHPEHGTAVAAAAGLLLKGLSDGLAASSVLSGTVPELAAPERRARAFGRFDTGTAGGGAAAPALFVVSGDALGVPGAMPLIAGMTSLAWPSAVRLRPGLR